MWPQLLTAAVAVLAASTPCLAQQSEALPQASSVGSSEAPSQDSSSSSQEPFKPSTGFQGIDGTATESGGAGEVPHRRHVFYVGGQRVAVTGGTNIVNQLYTEQLIPAKGVTQPNPLVFFHGGGFSGTTWLQTPDNRRGWASYFLDKGYAVYILDHTSIARSPRDPALTVINTATAEAAEAGFSAVERYNRYPQAYLHNQWPGNGSVGDPVFDGWYRSFIQIPPDFATQEIAMAAAGCELLRLIGPSFLVAHSYGGLFPWVIADKCSKSVQGIVGVEPDTSPFANYIRGFPTIIPTRPWGLTNSPLQYDPPAASPSDLIQTTVGEDTAAKRSCQLQAEPAKKLPNLSNVPVYVYTTEASIHITFAHCTIAYLRQVGIKDLTWQKLADIGIKGNGHFSFIEKNNLAIANVVNKWIVSKAGPKRP
ncbi:MAG: hypothetical protein M1825_003850 [Sarcosagium campestre]|nr:MAG: hypothetical protein M1825_003850 [Sarcosagium campestre]